MEDAELDHRVKVLYILGSARSGSTVFANLLGELQGFFSAGEVRFLWERVLQGRRCGCGEPVSRCPLWSGVIEDLNARGSASAEEMTRIDHDRLRVPKLRALLRPGTAADTERAAYTDAVSIALRSVASRTGARVVIDSSKRPTNGAALMWAEEIDVYYVHLVRDARAVAVSRSARKRNPDREEEAYIGGNSVIDSSVHWTASNAASDLVRRAAGADRTLLVRYEDFVAQPAEVLAAVGDLLGEPVDPATVLTDGEMRLGTNHAVSGNPDRFVTGSVQLRLDERWKTSMSSVDRAVAGVLCGPLLLRYRYRILGSRAA